jgi:hypothetical protein
MSDGLSLATVRLTNVFAYKEIENERALDQILYQLNEITSKSTDILSREYVRLHMEVSLQP